jgi:hypothetical protein
MLFRAFAEQRQARNSTSVDEWDKWTVLRKVLQRSGVGRPSWWS